VRTRDDAGQALPLLLLVVALAAVSIVGAAEFGARLVREAHAQSAADAAAVAGALGDEPAARSLAARNGAVLVSYRAEGVTVTVVVAIGPVTATARATRGP